MSAPGLKPCPFCGGDQIQSGHVRDGRCIGCTSCGSVVGAFNPNAEAEARRKWNTRADLAPSPAKVKALVWQDFEGQGAKASGFYRANYLVTLWRGRGQFEVSMSYPGYQTGFDGERWHATLEAAKAAAQADYEARILAALEE